MIEFLDLGRQPLANGFLTQDKIEDEYFFNLKVGFNLDTYMVSLLNFVPPKKMFNENYAYSSSSSKTMQEHFLQASYRFVDDKVLEIGSNDGAFIKNLNPYKTIAVEPCSNFADKTRKMGYRTYDEFWNMDLSEKIVKENGVFDAVYSANCMCHIQNIEEAFMAVSNVLSSDGVFVFEDPSMLDVIKNNSFDQFYDEHPHVFSLLSLQKLLRKCDMYIVDVEHLTTHGGSNRIIAQKKPKLSQKVSDLINIELGYKLNKIDAYDNFACRIYNIKKQLQNLFKYNSFSGYGATSKSTVVYNFCNIKPEFVTDTTPEKQGKLMPGVHSPIVPPTKNHKHYVFLGAWNYMNEILTKEQHRKFQFVTHVPQVTIL